jgi:hypothetical protein
MTYSKIGKYHAAAGSIAYHACHNTISVVNAWPKKKHNVPDASICGTVALRKRSLASSYLLNNIKSLMTNL